MNRRIAVILNPNARSARAGSLVDTVRTLIGEAPLFLAGTMDEARQLAHKAAHAGFEIVVAAGGDGTANHVVNGIAGSGAVLGVLPLGTMNVLATELRLPLQRLDQCWRMIQEAVPRAIDLPRANDHYFVQMAGIGFDAQVVQATPWEFKRQLGPLSYVIRAAQIAAGRPPRLIATGTDGPREGSFVLVGNGRHYGGPFVLFNDARIDDGLLDVLVFKNLGYLDIVRYLQAIAFGTHPHLPDVEYFQTATLAVRSDQEVPVEVDGEVIGNLPVDFNVRREGLRVISG